MDYMGLGIRLDFRDDMTRRVDPLIRDLERLERQAGRVTNSVNQANNNMFGSARMRMIQDYNNAMQRTDRALLGISQRMISAATSANTLATAMNRMQFTGNFNRMYQDIFRVQRQLAMMGYGMSRMQQQMSDTRAYNMMNYQLKDLHDRVKLTRQAIEQMQRSPDSSRFREQISLAQRSLREYETQLARANAQQQLMFTHGYRGINAGGQNIMMRSPGSLLDNITNRLVGMSMLDMAHASNFAYNSITRTANAMLGAGYTAMEARQKLTQLAGSLTMVGMAMSQFVTLPILIATAAIGAFAKKFEEMQNLFQARTLVSNVQMDSTGGFDNAMGRVWVNTGAQMNDIGKTFATIKNSLGNLPVSQVEKLAQNGIKFNKVWGIDSAQSVLNALKYGKKYGVEANQAMDIYTLALKEANGDMDKANKYIEKNIGSLKRMTAEGQKGAESFENMEKALERGGIERLLKGVRALSDVFRTMWSSGMAEVFGKIGDGLYKMGNGLNTVLQHNPALAKFLGYSLGLTAAFIALIGPVALVTGLFIRFRSVIQGAAASIFGLSRGGLAVLSPQAQMAKSRMDALVVSMARFPQTLLATIPLLYNVIRGFPLLVMRMAALNPVMTGLTVGLIAYANDWWGLKDRVNGAIDSMQKKWGELVKLYEASNLPKTLEKLKGYAKAFGTGFWEGLGVAIDIGKEFLDFVLLPIKTAFEYLDPILTNVANSFSKMFGGDGNIKEGVEKWKEIGKLVGTVAGGLLAIKAITSVSSFILSPFVKMNDAVKNVGRSLDGVITRLGLLGRAGAGGIAGAVSGGTGAVLAGGQRAGRFIFGSHGNNPVVGSPNILQRAGGMLLAPFSPIRTGMANGLAAMGIGQGLAMAQQRAQMRAEGRALSSNPALLSRIHGIRENVLDRYGRTLSVNPIGLSANGRINGEQTFMGRQSALSRALFGQRLYTYNPVFNHLGQQVGVERDRVGTSGGLFRRNQLTQGTGANIIQRGLSSAGLLSSFFMSRAMGAVSDRALRVPRAMFDRFTQSAVGQRLAGMGNWAANRLALSNVANPFAGAFRTTNATGDALTRRQRIGNFARTVGGGAMGLAGAGIRGVGSAAWGATAMAGRGAMGAARLGARAVGAPMRLAGAAMGGLMAAAPWLLAAGLVGKVAYDKLGVGADGKKSVGNVAGNMDKLTANIGKDGGKGIEEFWKKFKKHGEDILKATGRLVSATMKALAPKIPGMLKDAFNGIVGLAKWAWNWIETDGIKMAKAAGKGLMSILSSAWKWIKTDGVKYLGQFWNWFTSTALPKALSLLKQGFGIAWNWIKTDGVKYLSQFITWLIGTGVPWAAKGLWKGLTAAWNWIKDDGLKMFGQLLLDIGGIALSIGKALWSGITSALGSLGDFIKSKLPDWAQDFLGGKSSGSKKSQGSKGVGYKPGAGYLANKAYARGGIITYPHYGLVGEDGAESIIPHNKGARSESLLKQTAGILGFDVVPKGKGMGGEALSTKQYLQKTQTAPVRTATAGGKSVGSVDNSVTISKVEFKIEGTSDTSTMRKQAQEFMKELKKIVAEEKKRSGGKIDFDEILMNM